MKKPTLGHALRLLTGCSFLFYFTTTRAQTDTLFWFAAPEISVSFSSFDIPIVLRITTYADAATVTVSQPAGGGLPNQVVNIGAQSMATVDLSAWLNNIENKPANTVLNYGLKITSTAPVTIYYEVVSTQCQCNPEIFVLKGQNALGQNFFIPSQNFLYNNPVYNPLPYSAFDIVATEDNTNITITPTNAIVGHAAGVPFTILLHEGQSWSGAAAGLLAAEHLMGTTVTSNKDIAITYKDDLLEGGLFGTCSDLGGDQIVPVDILGMEYIATQGFLNAPGDQVFVLATENNTDVSINGAYVATINAGATYSTSVGGTSCYIVTTAPAYVLQLSGFGCEVGLDILPTILCTGSTSVSFTRSTVESLYTTLLVESGGEGNFLFNGSAGVIDASDFTAVPGTGGNWLSAQVLFSLAQTPMGTANIISNTTHAFHMGFIHGGAMSGCRFGYFSNFSTIEIIADAATTDVCAGHEIELLVNAIGQAQYTWTGPQNFTSVDQNPVIANAEIPNEGDYIVTATIIGCGSDSDTVSIAVNPVSTFAQTITLCLGDVYELPGGDEVNVAGVYSDTLTAASTCDSIITTTIDVIETLTTITNDLIICLGQSVQLEATGGETYFWSPAATLDVADIPNPIATPTETTTYAVTIAYGDDCELTEWVTIEVGPLQFETNITNGICLSPGSATIISTTGTPPYLYSVNGVEQNDPLFADLTPGNYTVEVSDLTGCIGTSVMEIGQDILEIEFDSFVTAQICESSGSLEITDIVGSEAPYVLFVENLAQKGFIVENINAGYYNVVVSDMNGCAGTMEIEIPYADPTQASFSSDPSSGEAPLDIAFTNHSLAANYFIWNFNDGNTYTTENAFYSYELPGTYDVQLLAMDTVHGCVDSISANIWVKHPVSLFVPNSFTPDDDGVNDVFIPIGNGILAEQYQLQIFNRWGHVIFETHNPDEPWTGNALDGTHFVPPGVYTWLIVLQFADSIEDERFEGHVTLIR